VYSLSYELAGATLQTNRRTDGDRLRRVPVWLAGADCNGDEARLTDCSGVTLESVAGSCFHSQDLSILCFSGDDPGVLPEAAGRR